MDCVLLCCPERKKALSRAHITPLPLAPAFTVSRPRNPSEEKATPAAGRNNGYTPGNNSPRLPAPGLAWRIHDKADHIPHTAPTWHSVPGWRTPPAKLQLQRQGSSVSRDHPLSAKNTTAEFPFDNALGCSGDRIRAGYLFSEKQPVPSPLAVPFFFLSPF